MGRKFRGCLLGKLVFAVAAVSCLVTSGAAAKPHHFSGWDLDDSRLSQPVYRRSVSSVLTVPTRHGFNLSVRVVRPATPSHVTVPVVLIYSPVPEQDTVRSLGYLVERGYAVAEAAVPGTGASEGCYDYGGKIERSALSDVIGHLANKPWSNGRVGMYGVSLAADRAEIALATGHRALWTAVAVAGTPNPYDRHYVNGVANLLAAGGFHTDSVPYARGCRSDISTHLHGLPWAGIGTVDGFWRERDIATQVEKVIIPRDTSALIVHGTRDTRAPLAALPRWLDTLRNAGVHTKLVLGRWTHGDPFTDTSRQRDWRTLVLRWFDRWLKEKPTEVEGLPGALVQDDEGQWRRESSWPSAATTDTTLFPAPEGRLRGLPERGLFSFVDDGASPDPRVAGPDSAFFSTRPLAHSLRLSGTPTLTLRASHTMPRGHVAVTLYEIGAGGWTPLSHGMFGYNLRSGSDRFTPVSPGEWFRLEVPLVPLEVVVPAGARLGLSVGSQARGFVLNGVPMTAAPSGGVSTVEMGRVTALHLPVLERFFPTQP